MDNTFIGKVIRFWGEDLSVKGQIISENNSHFEILVLSSEQQARRHYTPGNSYLVSKTSGAIGYCQICKE